MMKSRDWSYFETGQATSFSWYKVVQLMLNYSVELPAQAAHYIEAL